jgi:hypothetical protein
MDLVHAVNISETLKRLFDLVVHRNEIVVFQQWRTRRPYEQKMCTLGRIAEMKVGQREREQHQEKGEL